MRVRTLVRCGQHKMLPVTLAACSSLRISHYRYTLLWQCWQLEMRNAAEQWTPALLRVYARAGIGVDRNGRQIARRRRLSNKAHCSLRCRATWQTCRHLTYRYRYGKLATHGQHVQVSDATQHLAQFQMFVILDNWEVTRAGRSGAGCGEWRGWQLGQCAMRRAPCVCRQSGDTCGDNGGVRRWVVL